MSTTNSLPAAAHEVPRLAGRLKVVLAVLLVAQFMLAVDFSILNVALPAIGDDLGFSLADLQWVATAFALCAAGFTLFFGRIGDLIGRKRIFLGSLALLGAASLAGGLAPGPEVLIVARVAQGLATAAATPAGLALLTTSFPEGPLREKALGLNGALMSAGFTAGAVLGGVLTDLLSWRWAFFVNVPVAVAVLLVAPAVIAESRPAARPTIDLPGALSVTLGLLGVVYGLTRAGEHGRADPLALTGLLAGAVLLVVFYLVERRAAQPLVPVRVLRKRTVAWGNVLGLLLPATFLGGVGNMLVIVGFMVTATTGLPDHEQGLATGLASMSQQVGITMGTPIMSAVATAAAGGVASAGAILHGVTTAISVNAVLVLLGVLLAAVFLRRDRAYA
ncbi:MFS transporter [Microbispora hainanensis]|uniref:MFS transporter n=1 Tax=Microbispora hainanensis TaxID=568844 RepID=A0ABZ1SJ30_9ACTN|nr:MFS transporter [Microbispora hainanensis]